jgi:uncharacterized RDD family membrane protein YckC
MQETHEAVPARRIVVTTPEHVELRFETAGIGSRVGAQLIDTLVLVLINAALTLAWLTTFELVPEEAAAWMDETAAAVAILVLAAVNGGYFLIAEYATGGRTIGKRAMGLRVIQDNGRPLSFLAAVVRNLLRVIDALPMLYVVGALVSFLHPHDKRLGDLAAGTVVVYDAGGAKKRSKRKEKQLAAWAPAFPALTLESWTRERVNEEEWGLLSAFAERLPYLAPARAEQLARGLVEHLAPKLELGDRWAEAQEAEASAREALRQGLPQPAGGTPNVRGRSVPVAWALAIYAALRNDWELLPAEGGDA